MNKKVADQVEQSASSKLQAHITIKGLEAIENISADSTLEIETICTGRTSVEVNLLKS